MCEEVNIRHELSSAFNPESNGEAVILVKKVKLAISHAGDKLDTISATVANLNYDQRTDGSGSPAELFLQRTLRVPGLAHIPTHLQSTDSLKAAKALSRDKQVSATAKQRKPDSFHKG